MRERLPCKHKCVTQRLKVNQQTVHFSVGLYPDGRPGEVFIDMHKLGTSTRAWCGSTAKLMSLMLQYGIPLSEIISALAGQQTEAYESVPVSGHALIMEASGVLDAIVRSLAQDFLAEEGIEKPFDTSSLITALKMAEDMGAAEIAELFEDDSEVLDSFLGKFA